MNRQFSNSDSMFSPKRQRGSMLKRFGILLGLVIVLALISLPGYLTALPRLRAHDMKHFLANLAKAKESWAVEHNLTIGDELGVSFDFLVNPANEYMDDTYRPEVPGTFILGRVGQPPRFVPDPGSEHLMTDDFVLYLPPEVNFIEAEEGDDDGEPETTEAEAESEIADEVAPPVEEAPVVDTPEESAATEATEEVTTQPAAAVVEEKPASEPEASSALQEDERATSPGKENAAPEPVAAPEAESVDIDETPEESNAETSTTEAVEAAKTAVEESAENKEAVELEATPSEDVTEPAAEPAPEPSEPKVVETADDDAASSPTADAPTEVAEEDESVDSEEADSETAEDGETEGSSGDIFAEFKMADDDEITTESAD
jgi:Tfp pilus assembly protein PilE